MLVKAVVTATGCDARKLRLEDSQMPYGWMFIGALVACALSLLAIEHDPPDLTPSPSLVVVKQTP